MTDYATGSVTSADGTTIGYRRFGAGPPVIVVHGGMQASQHFTGLAAALADTYTVYVPDRRGRGMSGPHGDDFGVAREVEDIQALVAATGAAGAFGLSSGGLVVLRTALATPALTRIAVYEPPLSVDGSVPVAWVPRYDRELAAGDVTGALVTALKGIGVAPVLGRVPRRLLAPVLRLGLGRGGQAEDEVPIPELVPTLRYDLRVVGEMADTAGDYAGLQARVLLLGGTRGPDYLQVALVALAEVLPDARRVTLKGLDHSGPDNDGDPVRVGDVLRGFFLRE
ncbi:pimeloyl-ACP methyl ester carboxylesterase [Allocatelliglobosispora scoriae]|uniref:Pimeloyl-ACP methyl ester carboxylesterase n=1 Tax=Allocatelliglobosispora scoriae TaxID=643052 RepID=A0A841BF74_9ACTN|nr:alpha/beta hydrolase [Allocatelliglobosispora scoriae]MBB5866944.1 pimeloyl-ACP methyl ester carboxylesterase [Allocatelliglobosispora scoriae]